MPAQVQSVCLLLRMHGWLQTRLAGCKKNTEMGANIKLQAPDILLNVEVIKAEGLRAKDCNGLSDPFCTLYLSNVPTQRYNTSVKPQTLAPSWEEHFSLWVF